MTGVVRLESCLALVRRGGFRKTLLASQIGRKSLQLQLQRCSAAIGFWKFSLAKPGSQGLCADEVGAFCRQSILFLKARWWLWLTSPTRS